MRRKSPSKTPNLKPTAHIGKKGVTEAQVKEIAKQLEARVLSYVVLDRLAWLLGFTSLGLLAGS